MKPDPFQAPLDPKPKPAPTTNSFSYMRCCVFVFVGGIAVCAGCCGLSNYIVFHTKIPLAFIESTLEQNEDIDIEGISGTISKGFHIDKFRIRNEAGNWNELTDVDFRFNGIYELVREQRFIVEQFTVGGGEFYYEPFDASGLDGDLDSGDRNRQPRNVPGNKPRPTGDNQRLSEFRVDLFRLSNLKFINRETGVEFKIDEISIKGFQVKDGRLTNLGDITVESDHVEFHTKESVRFKDQPGDLIKRRFTGLVRATASDRILKDLTFEMDVCFARNGRIMTDDKFFDGHVGYKAERKGDTTITFQEFSFDEYFNFDGAILPSKVTGSVAFNPDDSPGDSVTYTIAPESTFSLGATSFEVDTTELTLKKDNDKFPSITAKSHDSDQPIRCDIAGLRKKPYVKISLAAGDKQNTPELFSTTIYSKSLSEISDGQRAAIDVLIKAGNEAPGKPADDQVENKPSM